MPHVRFLRERLHGDRTYLVGQKAEVSEAKAKELLKARIAVPHEPADDEDLLEFDADHYAEPEPEAAADPAPAAAERATARRGNKPKPPAAE